MPTPIPLGRETRDARGAARIAAQQQADNERQAEDSAALRPGQELRHARVGPADIGVAFLPQSAQDPAHTVRTAEPGYGSTVSTVLRSSGSLASALAFYRQELARQMPQATIDEQRPGPGFATLTASHSPTGSRVTVFVNGSSTGELTVTLTRWDRSTGTGTGTGTAPPARQP